MWIAIYHPEYGSDTRSVVLGVCESEVLATAVLVAWWTDGMPWPARWAVPDELPAIDGEPAELLVAIRADLPGRETGQDVEVTPASVLR